MRGLKLALTVLLQTLRALGRSRSDLILKNVALRQQIAVLSTATRLGVLNIRSGRNHQLFLNPEY